jgi:predicted RNA binding protein YcfA (HicA-like mRNA interferase family)
VIASARSDQQTADRLATFWNPRNVSTLQRKMKVREIIKIIEADGWFLVRTKGDHRQYHHPEKSGTVTVAGKFSVDVPPGTLNSILKQAGLKG